MHNSMPKFAAAALLASAAWSAHAAGFTLSSPTIKPGSMLTDAQVFKGFGCEGKNVSPALKWSGAPAGTKSYAVTVYDPDAPTGSGWWHWVVYNIPATTTELPEGAGAAEGKGGLPAGAVQGRTDFGSAAFGGACPPAGDKPHRYIFTVYALKTDKIDAPADASAALIGFMTTPTSSPRRASRRSTAARSDAQRVTRGDADGDLSRARRRRLRRPGGAGASSAAPSRRAR